MKLVMHQPGSGVTPVELDWATEAVPRNGDLLRVDGQYFGVTRVIWESDLVRLLVSKVEGGL